MIIIIHFAYFEAPCHKPWPFSGQCPAIKRCWIYNILCSCLGKVMRFSWLLNFTVLIYTYNEIRVLWQFKFYTIPAKLHTTWIYDTNLIWQCSRFYHCQFYLCIFTYVICTSGIFTSDIFTSAILISVMFVYFWHFTLIQVYLWHFYLCTTSVCIAFISTH